MAESDAKEQVAEVVKKESRNVSGRKKLLIFIGVAGLVVGLSAGAGGLIAKSAAASQTAKKTPAAEDQSQLADEGNASDEHCSYYDLEPIIVNLDEPRLARYIRATIVLMIKTDNIKPVSELIDKKKPELKSWLTVYLAGCSLEDVRGPKNLNRIRREIQDSFNEQLWSGGKPMIEKVLFKEFAIQ